MTKICQNGNKSKLQFISERLENYHNLADVIFFSSCKGLFGPTGLGFIAHKKHLKNFIQLRKQS